MARSRKSERSQNGVDLYYECCHNRNVGRIKAIEGRELVVNVNAGHGGGELRIPYESCHDFEPAVDDRVLLGIGSDGLPLLTKLKKSRQQKKRRN